MNKQLLTLIALCISFIGFSQTFTALDNNNNTLEFNVTSSTTVEVKDYISGGTDVDIPTTISHNATTYDVTGIGNVALLGNGLTSVVIPNSITSIGVGALQNNALTSVTIPNSITSISNNAFAINQLTSVTIPNNVISIGNNAFLNNNQLASVSLPEGLNSIGNDAFLNCQLNDVIIPSTVTSIGMRAFMSSFLATITSLATTPPAITTTPGNGGQDTFAADRSGIDLTVPVGTTNDYLANGWTGFNSITESGGAQVGDTFVDNFITYEITSLSPNEVEAIDYDMAGGSVVSIPANVSYSNEVFSVTSVGNLAFSQNQLVSVTIPNTVTDIGFISFGNNPTLTDVFSLATIPPTIITGTNDTFGPRGNINLHIPPGTTGAYVTDAGALWTGFNSVTEDALSIEEFDLASTVKIITSDGSIKVITHANAQLQHYEVYALTGAKIATGYTNSISTETWARGIYILKLDFDRGTVSKKIIIN